MRDPGIDTLRGLACVLLVTMHVIGFDGTEGIHVPDDSIGRWFADSFVFLRMPLFCFLSGYVYALRPLDRGGSYAGFLRGKTRRLLVPYVVFVPLIGTASALVPDPDGTRGFRPLSWLLYSINPYWFLLSTFWILAVIALCDRAGLLRRPAAVASLLGVLVVVNTTVPVVDVNLLQLGRAVALSTFFVAGLAASRFGWTRLGMPWVSVAAAVAVLLFLHLQVRAALGLPDLGPTSSLVGIALGVAFPLACIGLGLRLRVLTWIGGYSAGIFLVHPFVVAGMRVLLQRVGVENLWALFLAGSGAGIIGSIGVVVVMRRFRLGRAVLGERWRVGVGA